MSDVIKAYSIFSTVDFVMGSIAFQAGITDATHQCGSIFGEI